MKYFIVIQMLLLNLLISNAKATEIVIGHAANFSEPDTSAINPFNKDSSNGIELAIEDLTSELKSKSFSIKVINLDYGKTDIRAIKVAKDAIASPALAVIGFYESGQALLAAPLLESAGLPFVSPLSSARRLFQIGPHIFHMSFSNSDMGKAIASFASNQLKIKNALVITAADCAYCTDLAESFVDEAKTQNIDTTKFVFLSNDRDFAELDRVLKSKSFDAFVIPNYEIDSAKITAHILAAGYIKPFFGGDGWADANGEGFMRIVNHPQFEGYCTSHWVEDYSRGYAKAFRTKYLKRFKAQPTIYSASGYDAMRRILLALISLDQPSRKNLQERLLKLRSFEGVMGPYNYESSRKGPVRPVSILKSNPQKGRFEFTGPFKK